MGGCVSMGGMAERCPALVFHAADADRVAAVAVVAEIGVNHDGRVSVGRGLVDAAARAGADAVKFQYFHPDRLLSNQAELAGYQRGKASSQRELLAKLALPIDALAELVGYAHGLGLSAVVTPFSPEDPAELAGLGLAAIKTASPDAVNVPLLDAAAALGLPLLISTGTCTLDELAYAAALLKRHSAGGCLLHCVSSYPTPAEEAGLAGIGVLAGRFQVPVGYSDHTPLVQTGGLAVAAGAVVLEKHLTHDRDAPGPDHAASLDPEQFADYVRQARLAAAMLGRRVKDASPIEGDVRRVSRQSVCVVRDLPAGHVLAAGDLTVKRPGTGIPAADLPGVVGRTLVRGVCANDLLDLADLK